MKPRHLITRGDPGQNCVGPHMSLPTGEAHRRTPASTDQPQLPQPHRQSKRCRSPPQWTHGNDNNNNNRRLVTVMMIGLNPGPRARTGHTVMTMTKYNSNTVVLSTIICYFIIVITTINNAVQVIRYGNKLIIIIIIIKRRSGINPIPPPVIDRD